MFSTPSLPLYHPLLPPPICLMPLTPLTTPPPPKIQIHSPFLHARLPQMLPLVQYARRSPPLLLSTGSETKTSLTQMSPPPVSSTTQIKKTCRRPSYPQLLVLVPPFEHKYSAGPTCPFRSPMTIPSTGPLSLPSQEYETTSTTAVAVHTSSRLKRLSESAGLCNTEEPPTTMKKPCYSLPSWTTSRLESGMETDSTPSPPPTNVTFPTPAVPCHLQVAASTAASRARVCTVARGSAPSQPTHPHGSRGSGSQARHLGA